MKRAAPVLSALFLTALLFTGCAPLKDPAGLALLRGEPFAAAPRPDSLEAEIGIEPRESGLIPFTARVYARPLHTYRIDAFGFPSMIAASYLWNDGRWMWVRHDKKQVREGTGNALELEDSPLSLPDVHAVLGFLWGEPLPGFRNPDTVVVETALIHRQATTPLFPAGTAGVVRWRHRGESWEARIDPATGQAREVRSEALRIEYGDYKRLEGSVLPGVARIFVEGEWVVTLRLRELKANPSWRKNPFGLTAPASYPRVP